jgi:tetratricopeptide (TPR) repeat protein
LKEPDIVFLDMMMPDMNGIEVLGVMANYKIKSAIVLMSGTDFSLSKAFADYNKAIVLWPKNAVAYYNRGLAYSKKGESNSALKDFETAIALKPTYADAYFARGNAYNKRKKMTAR